MKQSAAIIVRKLTPPPSHWQVSRTSGWLPGLLWLLYGIAVPSAAATAVNWHPTDEIAAVAENHLKSMMGSATRSTTVRAGNLDARHRLTKCSEPLQPYLRRGSEIKARTIVGVRCAGDKPWKVYLPVDVIVTETVLVASRTLPRGHILSVDDVNPQRRDVSRLLSGYISDVSSLSGHQLKTQILAGKILTPAMLQAETAIRRGQTVTLIVGTGLLSIRTSGTALADGALKQRIRVKNTHSGRIVEGIVRSREDVEVLLPQSHNISTATPKVSPNLADTGSSNNDR